jgi:hypothetical protein
VAMIWSGSEPGDLGGGSPAPGSSSPATPVPAALAALAAPVVGLIFVVAVPILGLAALGWGLVRPGPQTPARLDDGPDPGHPEPHPIRPGAEPRS